MLKHDAGEHVGARERRRKARQATSVMSSRHPLWSVLQGVVSLALMVVAARHGVEGLHHAGGIDVSDVSGVAGVGVAGKLLLDLRKR